MIWKDGDTGLLEPGGDPADVTLRAEEEPVLSAQRHRSRMRRH